LPFEFGEFIDGVGYIVDGICCHRNVYCHAHHRPAKERERRCSR
jgi:hypothetical protein